MAETWKLQKRFWDIHMSLELFVGCWYLKQLLAYGNLFRCYIANSNL